MLSPSESKALIKVISGSLNPVAVQVSKSKEYSLVVFTLPFSLYCNLNVNVFVLLYSKNALKFEEVSIPGPCTVPAVKSISVPVSSADIFVGSGPSKI